MEWGKAKNITIIFLLILNILLGFLIFRNSKKYNLDDKQINNINLLLEQYNIKLNTQLIDKYEPIKELDLDIKKYDDKDLQNIFFMGDGEITSRWDRFSLVYEKEDEILAIDNNIVNYSNNIDNGENINNLDEAKKLCDEFIENMGQKGKGYSFDLSKERDGNYILEYRQSINDIIIYNNSLIFMVNEKGIRNIDYAYSLPTGYSGDLREINSIDQILFTFTVEIRNERDKPIDIDKIDLIYYSHRKDDKNDDKINNYPAYRIYYSYEGESPCHNLMIINAYTSEIEIY